MYRAVYNEEALRHVLSLRPARLREFALRQIEWLAQNPFTIGDFVVREETGRENQIKVFTGPAIAFWPDHPVKELRIVDVRKLAH